MKNLLIMLVTTRYRGGGENPTCIRLTWQQLACEIDIDVYISVSGNYDTSGSLFETDFSLRGSCL